MRLWAHIVGVEQGVEVVVVVEGEGSPGRGGGGGFSGHCILGLAGDSAMAVIECVRVLPVY